MNNLKGLLSAVTSSATFGLIPLFTLPLMAHGMVYDSILVFRFLAAAVMIGLILLVQKKSFSITAHEAFTLVILSLFYDASAYFLFWSYNYLSSGIATSISFLYPVFVTLIMITAFKAPKSISTFISIAFATLGVIILSYGEHEHGANLIGVIIALCSALGYALYIVGINKSMVKNMETLKMTFYVLVFGTIILTATGFAKQTLAGIPDLTSVFNILMLALIPTVVANLTLVYSIKNIGSIITSIMGAMEPVTAVGVGVIAFGEPFTDTVMAGIFFVIMAVTIIVLSRPIDGKLKGIINITFGHLGIKVK